MKEVQVYCVACCCVGIACSVVVCSAVVCFAVVPQATIVIPKNCAKLAVCLTRVDSPRKPESGIVMFIVLLVSWLSWLVGC